MMSQWREEKKGEHFQSLFDSAGSALTSGDFVTCEENMQFKLLKIRTMCIPINYLLSVTVVG
jgi:hypothetical protein